MLVLPRLFLGVVAYDVAPPPLAVTHDHLLDAQVAGDLLVTSGTSQHVLRDLAAAMDRPAHDVLPTPKTQRPQVRSRDHPGITDKHTAT